MNFRYSATIGELLGDWDLSLDVECGMYVFTGLGVNLYAGISGDPVNRVIQHLGLGSFSPSPDLVGRIVLAFRPESLAWRVFFPTVDETISFSSRHFVHEPNWNVLRAHGPRAVAERCEWVFIQQMECLANSAKAANGRSEKFAAVWEAIYARMGTPSVGGYLDL